MQLESERLILREFALEDWPAVNAYTSDPTVVRYMAFGPTTAEQTREHLSQCLATAAEQPRRIYEMAVTLRARTIDRYGDYCSASSRTAPCILLVSDSPWTLGTRICHGGSAHAHRLWLYGS